MATYKKRGFKPKTKEEEQVVEEMNSTTAEVFNTLDERASKTEAVVSKYQNYILGTIVLIAVAVLGYLAYNQFVVTPKNDEAANDMSYPMKHFNDALNNEVQKDSLLGLALAGAEGKFGLLDIIEEYSGTPTANLAYYSAGMAYLNLQEYQKAIEHLEQFNSDDEVYASLALGGIGDAFSQLGQYEDALEYYEKAVSAAGENAFTGPKYLYKAGILAMDMGNTEQATTYFNTIKEQFPNSTEASNVEVLLGMVE